MPNQFKQDNRSNQVPSNCESKSHFLTNAHRAYNSLSEALDEFKYSQPEQTAIDAAIQRGYFIPQEDDYLWSLVSRYMTIRIGFWELIEETSEYFSDDIYNSCISFSIIFRGRLRNYFYSINI